MFLLFLQDFFDNAQEKLDMQDYKSDLLVARMVE